MPDTEKLAAVRAGLPATGAGIHLNTGTAGPIPAETAAAMAELAQWEVTTGRAHRAFHEEAAARMEEARAAVAAVIHADLDAVALTHGATDGMNAALGSVDWRPGDNLVTTIAEFPGVQAGIRALASRQAVDVRWVDPGADDNETLAAISAAIDRRTRIVAVSHVLWATGDRLPVERIGALLRSVAPDALLAVDAAQSVGAIPVDVDALGADLLSLPAQKWLLGPAGMGALYVSPRSAAAVKPMFAGVYSLVDPGQPERGLHPDARRFDAASFHAPSVAGMARSCGWLSMYVGLDWIFARGGELARRAFDRLAGTPGVVVLTRRERLATMVTFRLKAWPAGDALDELGRRTFVIARHVPTLDAIRISTAFFSTEAELDRFCDAVSDLAAHTPETFVRRPALTILGQRG